ncbi:MAG: TylF/MycF/NovP-related O-methyltransferase [Gammaproteobacteria bacterium]
MSLKQLFRKGLERAGYTAMRLERYRTERAELIEAKQNLQALKSEVATLRMQLDAAAGTSPEQPGSGFYTAVFTYDGLHTDPRIIHNHDFMRDSRYVRAYKLGQEALGHDHKMFWRLHVALWAAAHGAKLEGDFVECGVWRGFLSTAIMNYVDWPKLNKHFFLFDTFAGLDERLLTEAERANQQKLDHFKVFYTDCYEFVKQHFANYDRVQVVKGTVPDTLTQAEIGKVSFLSIDMNCTQPEISAANFFWDKLVPGAIVLLDDYGFVSYEEQKQGFDAFAKQKQVEILALPTGQGVIIKN